MLELLLGLNENNRWNLGNTCFRLLLDDCNRWIIWNTARMPNLIWTAIECSNGLKMAACSGLFMHKYWYRVHMCYPWLLIYSSYRWRAWYIQYLLGWCGRIGRDLLCDCCASCIIDLETRKNEYVLNCVSHKAHDREEKDNVMVLDKSVKYLYEG